MTKFETSAVVAVAIGGGIALSLTPQSQFEIGTATSVSQQLDAIKSGVQRGTLHLTGEDARLVKLAGGKKSFADK
jgi:hypothetical protein